MSNAHLGANHHMFGKTHSDETKLKISKSLQGRKLSKEVRNNIRMGKLGIKRTPHTEETKRKISIAKKNAPIINCPHCEVGSINKAVMTRWHFDNCKKQEV